MKFLVLLLLFHLAGRAATAQLWMHRAPFVVIATIDLDDRIGRFSPVGIDFNLDKGDKSVNITSELSPRTQRRMYKALEDHLGKMVQVAPQPDRNRAPLARYSGWPALEPKEAIELTRTGGAVVIHTRLTARRMQVRLLGISGSRLVPVLRVQASIVDLHGKTLYKARTKQKGDANLGGNVQLGQWAIGSGNVILEKEVLELWQKALLVLF
jgi:hypothetical protein